MKLSYNGEGFLCEFILMTVGEKDAQGQKHKTPRASSAAAKSTARPELDAGSRRESSVGTSVATENRSQPGTLNSFRKQPTQQNTPGRPRQPGFEIRPQPMAPPPPPPPPASTASDSLFVPQDEDQEWEPLNPDEEEEETGTDRLEWNSNNEPVRILVPVLPGPY
jgi:cell cycle checkpoint control protein RAD9A